MESFNLNLKSAFALVMCIETIQIRFAYITINHKCIDSLVSLSGCLQDPM